MNEMWKCEPNQPFPPQVAVVMVFTTALETLTKSVLLLKIWPTVSIRRARIWTGTAVRQGISVSSPLPHKSCLFLCLPLYVYSLRSLQQGRITWLCKRTNKETHDRVGMLERYSLAGPFWLHQGFMTNRGWSRKGMSLRSPGSMLDGNKQEVLLCLIPQTPTRSLHATTIPITDVQCTRTQLQGISITSAQIFFLLLPVILCSQSFHEKIMGLLSFSTHFSSWNFMQHSFKSAFLHLGCFSNSSCMS